MALARDPWLLAGVPALAIAMFYACWMQSRRAEIIHAHWSACGLIGGTVGALKRIPVVTTIWGEDATRVDSSFVYRSLMRLCILLSRRIVCVSDAMSTKLKARFPRQAGRIGFIPNGAPDAFLEIPRSVSPQTGALTVNLLIVGSLIPRKGVDLAIKAMAAIHQDRPGGCRLRIVGDGPEKQSLQSLTTQLGLGEFVTFVGAQTQKQVATLMEQADAMLLCSYSEGMPTVLLEGMAAGLAVVSSDIDGVRELLQPCGGLLFVSGDIDHLARQLLYLLDHPTQVRQLGQAARQSVIERQMRCSDVAAAYIALYRCSMRQA